MAATEQPLKKRKLYDRPPSSPPPQPPLPPQEPPPQPLTPPPFSQEEILRRRRSQEEIRNVFDCYKRIKFCIDQKDKHFMPELQEAYHSLITASGGAASVQRLVAEYIPRYASYCPTALEAAGNAVINMYNQCSTVISRGEDIDGIAFETAKSCISGLVDICQAAASDTPTSEFIQATRSAVFLNVFTFFASSFKGKSIFDIIDQKILKIYDVAESLSDFKREVLEEDNPILLKLSKLCTLSFLRIFFNFPKYSLVACFELLESTGVEGIQKGKYLLQQFTVELNYVGANHMDGRCNDELFTSSSNKKCHTKDPVGDFPSPKGNPCISALRKNCLLGMVLNKDPSLKRLIFSRYKVLHDSASSEIVSDTTSILEGVFESFVLQVKEHDNQIDTVEGTSVSSKYRDPGDMSSGRMFMPRELLNRQSFSPRARTPRDFRNNSFNNRSHSSQIERNPIPNSDLHVPALRPSTGSSNSPFESPNQNIPPPHSSADHAIWYSDGDPAAMDIFPASRQLWLGSLGPEASEMHIRFQFEKFGIIDQLRCFPFKGFATVEYRNIMDALKAREVMRGRSPWGACLRVKFLDSGLGTRGAINGTAVGSSCHVYIGNVPSIWAKDEMMHEVKKVLRNGPRMVFDLSTEGALLMEFNSPEEATIAIAHLRWHRKENSNYFPPHAEGPKPASTSLHVDMRNIGTMELTSPRMSQENRGPSMQSAHAFQLPWTGGGTMEVGRSGTAEQPWMYGKPESGMHSGGGIQNSGPSVAPPQPVQASAFNRPVYAPPNSSWDARGPVHHPPLGPMYSGAMPTNAHANLQGPPFLPASVTPLSQIQGSSMAPFNQMYSVPVVPPPLSSLPPPPLNMPPPLPTQSDFCPPLPPHPELQPPLPPTPPPVPPPPPPPPPQPRSHSPAFIPPPPPSSSPSPPLPASVESFRSPRYPWQGILSKSGVHYCTIHAQRVDSDICNYSSAIAEPAEWPAKLDITKRTDLRHVKSTFSSTPRHRREICWLLPSSHGDHKGLQDFISYLKQRDCAGVIKIPAAKSMWARLLFILPYSPETCSLLSIPPNPSLCLIGLVLPKETNSE